MKKLLFFVLLLIYGFPALSGVPNSSLAAWNGVYNVSKCIHCPDAPIDGQFNLKDFSWFEIASGVISKEDLLECSSTNIWFSYSVSIKSDRGASLTTYSNAGQCEWGFDKNLEVTKDTLTYTTQGKNFSHKKVELSLKRISQDLFELSLHVTQKDPSWGFPSEWEYKAELKKSNE